MKRLIGNVTALRALSPKNFVDDTYGLPTVIDILRELEKPGRDPRPAFKAAVFRDGIETLDDLKPGMVLEGTVTNVAAFGAFIDVGVHLDGLVHISAMSKDFVKDPRAVVKPGDIVRVKVLEVDKTRKRIALTLRLEDEVGPRSDRAATTARHNDGDRPSRRPPRDATVAGREERGGALADALRRARENQN
jgi:protein Tex